ncbi:MAG: TonB-dependent receptor [Gammaproteobacteria bacterium]
MNSPVYAALLTASLFTLAIADSRTVLADESAETVLEEVVVSGFYAQDRSEVLSSMTLLDEAFIKETAVQHFEELTQFVPNLNWAGGVSRARYFQIRGIGERSQYEGAPNPSVGFIIDDLDVSGLGGVATLFDVDQVEVLRGPQGTRYGANALAGLIYVKYRQPTELFSSNVSATVGNDGNQTLGVAVGGPVNDVLTYRAVLQQHQSNGFRDNAFLDRDDTNGRDELSSRIKLRYEPNDDWRFDLTAMHVDLDNGYDAFAVDNSFTTQSNRPGADSQQTSALVLSTNVNLGEKLVLQSISGAARSDVVFSFDADWGNDQFWDPVVYDYFSSTLRDRQTLSQEFRLKSVPGSDAAGKGLDWVIGALIRDERESNATTNDGNFEGFPDNDFIAREFDATNVALFADVNFALSDRLTLNAGLRVEQRDAGYEDSAGDQFSPDETNVGGQLALSFQLRDDVNLFGKVSRGYKTGGFNLGLPENVPDDALLFDAEYLFNYEVGVTADLWDGRLALDAVGFWMQRTDQQVQSSRQLDPNNPTTFIFFTDNAGEGRNRGIEITANYGVTESFSVYANLGLLDTRIEQLASDPDREGRDQAHAPRYSYALGGRLQFTNNWFARLDVTGKDKFFFSDSHDQRSNAYSLVNARVGYDAARWSVSAWARNVFDEQYAVRGFFFGNEPARDFVDTLYTRQGDPRTVGVSFDWRFE